MDKKTLRRLLVGEFSLKRLARSIIFIYAVICLYAYFFTDRQLFPAQPSSYQDTREILKLRSANDVEISAVYLPNPAATYTILYSHGNAEDLGDVLPTLREIRKLGFAVFAYDYQGYGTSQGKPTEFRTYRDIDAAYNYVTQKLNVPPNRMIIYGRSVGSGPSVDLASRQPVAGLVLENPFITAFRTVTRIAIVPFDKFNNLSKIQRVRCPILIMHGKADEVIPFWHGQELFAAANEPKRFLSVEGARHNDIRETAGDRYSKVLQEFAELIKRENAKYRATSWRF